MENEKTAIPTLINYFLLLPHFCLGDFISLRAIKQGRRRYLNSIKYDIKLLSRLQNPTTCYDLIKEFGYAHSSAHGILQDYLRQEIIKTVKTEKIEYGIGFKRYYRLTDLGFDLFNILEKINKNRMNKPKVFR